MIDGQRHEPTISVDDHAWQRFAVDWRAESPGEHRIQCRATDARGRTQPPRHGRNRIHEVTITVE